MEEGPPEIQHTVKLDRRGGSGQERDVRDDARPCLVAIAGPDLGLRHPLESTVTLGRDPTKVDLHLSDPLVSSLHARIEERAEGWAFVDLGSTNGSQVNGESCGERILDHGDKIAMGATVLRFEIQDAGDQAYDAELERMISYDDLTGLYLRRRFDRELAALLAVAAPAGRRVGLLVMDLDGLKGINDQNGHLFGAYTISESGRVIGRVLDERGFAARFGGDEFVAALPDLDLDQAEAVAETIREAIAAHPFEYQGVALHPGISIGVASFPESATDPRTLFHCADEALYRAKGDGKNCVRR